MVSRELFEGLDPDQDSAVDEALEPDPFADAPALDWLRRMYRSYDFATSKSREDAEKHAAYLHGDQLSPLIKATLRERGQPQLYWNKIRPAIMGTLGLLEANQTSVEAVGRNEDDEDAAKTATQVLRYLLDASRFDGVRRDCSRDFFVYGTGAAIIRPDDKTTDPRVEHVPWREFFHDPLSTRHDFRDAKYLGIARWYEAGQALSMFPEAVERLGDFTGGAFTTDGVDLECAHEHKPIWVDSQRSRVRIVELYYYDWKLRDWCQAIYCHAGLLEFQRSPYVDDTGTSVCPITAASYEVDLDGTRYGAIRDMMPLQDAINNNRSKTTNILNTSRVEVVPGSQQVNPADKETARKEAQRPDGVLPEGYKIIPPTDIFQGVVATLNNDVQAIDRMAPNPALLARGFGANESGRARLIAQQAGYTELVPYFALLERWEEATYERLWWAALQLMTEERTIRITDDEGSRKRLTINEPVYQMTAVQALDPLTGQTTLQPIRQQVGMRNHLAQLEMDIMLTTVRQAATLRGESVEKALEWAAKTGVSPLSAEFEFVIEMSDIADKEFVLAKCRAGREQSEQQQAQQAQAQAEQAQRSQAVIEASTQSKMQRDAAQSAKDHAVANKHNVEAQSDALDLALKNALLTHLPNLPGGSPAL